MTRSKGFGNDCTDPVQQKATGKMPDSNTKQLNLWPANIPDFQDSLNAYYVEALRFAKALVRIFALALDLEETAFDQDYEQPLTDITVQHYPAQEIDPEDAALMPHADYSTFTLLLQHGIGGLQ